MRHIMEVQEIFINHVSVSLVSVLFHRVKNKTGTLTNKVKCLIHTTLLISGDLQIISIDQSRDQTE